MKIHSRIFLSGAIVTASALACVAQAQGMSGMSSHDHHAAAPAAKPAESKVTGMSEGEVRKVDKENRKITLKHGPLTNLDMPAMTMAFQVTDVAMLDKVKAGDKVRFVAANPGGKLTVTEIRLAE
jgi:Cu(I)/Ag(I) efflux system protein CusF